MRSLLLIVALALPLFSQAASEADQRATEQQIDALKREISQVEARIGARNRAERERAADRSGYRIPARAQ
jgi:hypothetical protein